MRLSISQYRFSSTSAWQYRFFEKARAVRKGNRYAGRYRSRLSTVKREALRAHIRAARMERRENNISERTNLLHDAGGLFFLCTFLCRRAQARRSAKPFLLHSGTNEVRRGAAGVHFAQASWCVRSDDGAQRRPRRVLLSFYQDAAAFPCCALEYGRMGALEQRQEAFQWHRRPPTETAPRRSSQTRM